MIGVRGGVAVARGTDRCGCVNGVVVSPFVSKTENSRGVPKTKKSQPCGTQWGLSQRKGHPPKGGEGAEWSRDGTEAYKVCFSHRLAGAERRDICL